MRAYEITEALTSPYSYTIKSMVIRSDAAVIKAYFSSPSGKYEYSAVINYLGIRNDDVLIRAEVFFRDEDGEMRLTGQGDAFRILATVIDITKQLINNQKLLKEFIIEFAPDELNRIEGRRRFIDIISFSAYGHEKSRVKLYSRFAKNIPGYRLYNTSTHEGVVEFNVISNDIQL